MFISINNDLVICELQAISSVKNLYLKVKAESHNDVKSLVAAITKGLMTQQLKAHALYCWLTSLDLSRPPKGKHKSTAPATKVKALIDKKLTYAQFYQELCR